MAKTNYGETEALTALLSGTMYVALHTGNPGETGASNELSGNGYARQGTAFTTTGASSVNDDALTFGPATADWGTVSHLSIWDASTSGNCVYYGVADASVEFLDNDSATIAAGDLDVTES